MTPTEKLSVEDVPGAAAYEAFFEANTPASQEVTFEPTSPGQAITFPEPDSEDDIPY